MPPLGPTAIVGRPLQKNWLVARDLIQQVGPHGRIADPTAGDLDGPDFQCIRIDPEVNLAPVPWLGRPKFLGQSLAIP